MNEEQQSTQPESKIGPAPKSISFSEFLESTPTTKKVTVANLGHGKTAPNGNRYFQLEMPVIQLHCTHKNCNGLRFFRTSEEESVSYTRLIKFFYLTYTCSNCKDVQKIFSLH